MTFMPSMERRPTPRERAYLEALAAGEKRPSISGQAGHMCRRLGWCEVLYKAPGGLEAPRSALPVIASIAIVKAGYRAVGCVLTARGRDVLAREQAQ